MADSTLGKGFARCKFLVLDEADRLLEPSFEGELRTILSALPPSGRQTLLFSATMTKSLIKLQKAALTDAYIFKVGLPGQLCSLSCGQVQVMRPCPAMQFV